MAFHSSRDRALAQMGVARGDPGIFDIFKTIGRGISGAVGGLLGGGPIGAIVGGIKGFTQQQQRPLAIPPPPVGITIRPGAILPGGVPFVTAGRPALPGAVAIGAACPKGFHLNKSSYHTRAGLVPAGTKCVRNRSRNFTNQRALRRATSRVQGFERQVRRSRKALRRLAKI